MKRIAWMVFLLVASGCGKSGRDAFAEGQALEAQGKVEEAARMYELGCAYAPDGKDCGVADRRAAEARLAGAEKAMGAGQFVAASRLLVLALATADAQAAQKATERLASDDLQQGLAYERARALATPLETMAALAPVAASRTPAAALAKTWLDKERPGLLVAAVKAGCGPTHQGSCSKAAAELRAAALTGPDSEAALALVEEEERRIYASRAGAETVLQGFASVAKRDALMETCKVGPELLTPPGTEPSAASAECVNSGLGASYVLPAAEVEAWFLKHQANEIAWRAMLKPLDDTELVAALEARRKEAEAQGHIDKLVLPKPKPASRSAGGKK